MPISFARARQLLRQNDPKTRPALDALLARVAPLLDQAAPSVMDKTTTPPSGDKHDYISVGPYWWPNPDTPDGLPYIRRDGEKNPERFTNATDVVPLRKMTDAVTQLLIAFGVTDDSRYASTATRWLRTWFIDPATRMNPNLRFGQAIPGVTDGRGIGIIDTVTFVELLEVLRAVRPALTSTHWSATDEASLRAWLRDYIDWLFASPLGLTERLEHNNHGTWYDAQVATFALYCDLRTVAKEICEGVLDRRIAKHIEPDGRQPHELARTRPMTYAGYNLHGFIALADVADEVGVDLWYAEAGGRSIRRACEWFVSCTFEPAANELDTLAERASVVLPILRRATGVYRDDAFEASVARLPAEVVATHVVNLTWPAA